jgi:EAL domain-containing protein (putative c-di-GMP-specific phosphodiesterase class I)
MSVFHSTALPGPLGTVLQTIVDTTAGTPSVFAVECLTRGPRGTRLEQAPPLFDYIRRRGLETEIDCEVVGRALTAALGRAPRIALNVHPSTLADHGRFVRCLITQTENLRLDPASVIIEVGEHAPASDPVAFADALRVLRERGFAIAVDDVGFGYSNYKAILDCRPDYLKIDRYFVHGASNDPAKVAVVGSILALADYFGARVIAEGVEDHRDYEVLKRAGIDLFQGFLFSRPVAAETGNDDATRWDGASGRRRDSAESRGLPAAVRQFRARSRARA